MRFLITGGAGFIGSHLADRLTDAGHTILGVDNYETGRADNFTRCATATLCELDVCDRVALYEQANTFEPDVVIHCAASYSDPNLWHRDTDTNVAGTINAALVAKFHNARLVYFQTALPPISSYAISKLAGGEYIRLSGVPQVTFRLSNIYGPRNISGPIPTFFKRLTNGEACTVTDTRRDMVYIDDLVRAVLVALDREATGTIDICSGKTWPIITLFAAVADAIGSNETPHRVGAASDDVGQMELNPARARDVLDWVPHTSLNLGVQAAVEWYREHGVGDTYTHLKMAS